MTVFWQRAVILFSYEQGDQLDSDCLDTSFNCMTNDAKEF